MRLAAISDMHGNITAFEAVVADLRQQSPDLIVCLGDVSLRGSHPVECIDLLKSLPLRAIVRGNHDQCLSDPDWVPRNFKEEVDLAMLHYHNCLVAEADRDWLTTLPTFETLTLEDVRTELFHAAPWTLKEITWPWAPPEDLRKLCAEESAELVLFGHIHHAFIRQAEGRLVVNAGSVGLPFDGDQRASYAVIDIEQSNLAAQIRRVAYDVERAIRLAREMPYGEVIEKGLRTARFPF